MSKRLGVLVMAYAAFLLICGCIGWLLPTKNSGVSLLSGLVFGTITLLFGLGIFRQQLWTLPATVGAVGVFTCTFVWRAIIQWLAVSKGDSEFIGVAVMLTVMIASSAVVLRMLLQQFRL
jgi:uncharacterized membrane protein (UPF0136 family)